jgi:tetratricopeptide (TPR) repeat protein
VVDKKVFDAVLLEFMDKMPGVYYTALIDSEGYPISFVASAINAKRNPKTISSVMRTLMLPAYNYRTAYKLSRPMLGVFMFKEIIILEFNLGYGLLGVLLDRNEWPVATENFEIMLRKLFNHLPNLRSHRKSMLQDLFKDEAWAGVVDIDVEVFIPSVVSCLQKLGGGMFNPVSWEIPPMDAKTLCAQIGQNLGATGVSSVIVGGGQALFQSGLNAELMAKIAFNAIDIQMIDPPKLQLPPLLLEVYCYDKGELVLGAVVGKIENQPVKFIQQLPSWSVGLNEAVSGLYSAAAACHGVIGSEESVDFLNLMNFLVSSVSDLRSLIEQSLNDGKTEDARALMKRSIRLLQNMNEYSVAGDYLKWLAYTYYEIKDFPNALVYYKQAADSFQKGNDFENLAANCLDIASLNENIKDFGQALEFYEKATQIYRQLGATDNAQSVEQKIKDIQTALEQNIVNYLSVARGEEFQLPSLALELKIPASVLPGMLQRLVEQGTIPGQVNTLRGLYTKKIVSRTLGAQTTPTSASINRPGVASVASTPGGMALPTGTMAPPSVEVKFVDYRNAMEELNKLNSEIVQLNSELNQTEQKFQMKGINFMEILKYQAKLEKKKLDEIRIKMYKEMPQFNAEEGTPVICAVCMNELNESEPLGVCVNGHGYHMKCLSSWIKSQDRCPVCDIRLVPFVLRDYREALGGGSSGMTSSEKAELQSLREQVQLLKGNLGGQTDLFDKLVSEKEDKNRLLNDLKKKDQLINELRSQLKAVRR